MAAFAINFLIFITSIFTKSFNNNDSGDEINNNVITNEIDTNTTNGELWLNDTLLVSNNNILKLNVKPYIKQNIGFINIVKPKQTILNEYSYDFYSNIQQISILVDDNIDYLDLYWNISENALSMFTNLKKLYIENNSNSKMYNIEPGIPKSVAYIDLDGMQYMPFNKNYYSSLEKSISFNGYKI